MITTQTMNKAVRRKEGERQFALLMIQLFCEKKHGSCGSVCENCRILGEYACSKLEQCAYIDAKTFCNSSAADEGEKAMQDQMQSVMSYSGKRIALRHPLSAMRHALLIIGGSLKQAKRLIQCIYIGLGFLCIALGVLGIALPILPTTPFLLAASFFFAKGSKRFHRWFMSTGLYKKHLESFVKSRAMTLKSKLCILLPVSAMLIVSFILVPIIYARITIALLFVGKYLYFFTQIKTIKAEPAAQQVMQ